MVPCLQSGESESLPPAFLRSGDNQQCGDRGRGQGGKGGRQTGSSGQSPIVRAESAAEGAQLHLTGSDDR